MAEVAVEAGRRGREHDAAVGLLAKDRPGVVHECVATLEMRAQDGVPIALVQVVQGGVAQHPGVAYEGIDAAPGIDGPPHGVEAPSSLPMSS